MATKPMKLKCRVTLEDDRTFTIQARLYDGAAFKLTATEYDFRLNENFLPSKRTVDGWLFVQQEAQQHDRVYITLPKPSITHGHHLTVSELDLMPRYASIDDFKPKDELAVRAQMGVPLNKLKTGLTKGKKKPEVKEVVAAEEAVEMHVETKSDVDPVPEE